jgi:hypothetical protein
LVVGAELSAGLGVKISADFVTGGKLQEMNWRTYQPEVLFEKINQMVQKRIG